MQFITFKSKLRCTISLQLILKLHIIAGRLDIMIFLLKTLFILINSFSNTVYTTYKVFEMLYILQILTKTLNLDNIL